MRSKKYKINNKIEFNEMLWLRLVKISILSGQTFQISSVLKILISKIWHFWLFNQDGLAWGSREAHPADVNE